MIASISPTRDVKNPNVIKSNFMTTIENISSIKAIKAINTMLNFNLDDSF